MKTRAQHLAWIAIASAFLTCSCNTGRITPYSECRMKRITNAFTYDPGIGSVKLPCRIYISDSTEKRPLVLFLHGAAERGSDNEKQLSYGISHIVSYLKDNGKDAVVLAPQCPSWLLWKSDEAMMSLERLLAHFMSLDCVDRSRVYVTGFSMGGEGTWILGLKHQSELSTIVPICGGPLAGTPYDYSTVDNSSLGLNVWSFNYADDTTVDNTYSRFVVGKLWNVSTNSVHYTESLTGGHTAEIYENKDMLDWMFNTERK